MALRQVPDRFLVAFSLAGEQGELVRAIAEEVERDLGRSTVFYWQWYQHYLAGADADLKLQEIYESRCELAVVCVSGSYGGKAWPRAEHEAIRARLMLARETEEEADDLGILPLRVGDGEVKGLKFNTIAPDVRQMSAAEAAELILARLRLIRQSKLPEKPPALDWPDQAPKLKWPIADHSKVRMAFERLLTSKAPWRFLPVKGPSESGKTHISRQLLGNGLRLPNLACGRFDFKGTTDMDDELRAFVEHLDVPQPEAGGPLNERLGTILAALKRRAEPALLIFDTYETAGEAEHWVEKQLLTSLIRATWLRVVITGQEVPDVAGTIWELESSPVIELELPPAKDWWEWGRQHRPDLELQDVEAACRLTDKATVLAQLLGPGS